MRAPDHLRLDRGAGDSGCVLAIYADSSHAADRDEVSDVGWEAEGSGAEAERGEGGDGACGAGSIEAAVSGACDVADGEGCLELADAAVLWADEAGDVCGRREEWVSVGALRGDGEPRALDRRGAGSGEVGDGDAGDGGAHREGAQSRDGAEWKGDRGSVSRAYLEDAVGGEAGAVVFADQRAAPLRACARGWVRVANPRGRAADVAAHARAPING